MNNIEKMVWERFYSLREKVFRFIQRNLENDGYCKSYEGAFKIHFPNYFEEIHSSKNSWALELDCYVIGPSRSYMWSGDSLNECFDKAEKDIDSWIFRAEEGLI